MKSKQETTKSECFCRGTIYYARRNCRDLIYQIRLRPTVAQDFILRMMGQTFMCRVRHLASRMPDNVTLEECFYILHKICLARTCLPAGLLVGSLHLLICPVGAACPPVFWRKLYEYIKTRKPGILQFRASAR